MALLATQTFVFVYLCICHTWYCWLIGRVEFFWQPKHSCLCVCAFVYFSQVIYLVALQGGVFGKLKIFICVCVTIDIVGCWLLVLVTIGIAGCAFGNPKICISVCVGCLAGWSSWQPKDLYLYLCFFACNTSLVFVFYCVFVTIGIAGCLAGWRFWQPKHSWVARRAPLQKKTSMRIGKWELSGYCIVIKVKMKVICICLGGKLISTVFHELCAVEWVTCNFFWYLSCFKQGWMHVTPRNNKYLGLGCFMLLFAS